MITNLKNKQIVVNDPKSKQVVQTSQPLQSKNPETQTNYIYKEKFVRVLQMEPEFWDSNPNKVPAKIFPPGFQFMPLALNKTQTFYEFILVDSDSISIKHYKDGNDMITHSTIQILKIISPKAWGNPNTLRKFSQFFDPIGYTYWDYVQAWTNVIWYQNKQFKHSWLIYFKQGAKYYFPQWFRIWWNLFGPIPQILPEHVLEGFNIFSKRFNRDADTYPIELHFFEKFSLAWIFSWQYKFIDIAGVPTEYPALQRKLYVKWWSTFDATRANADNVMLWFKKNPKYLQVADPETCKFLNQRSQATAALAAATNEEQFVENLEQMLKYIKQQKSAKGKEKEKDGESSQSTETVSDDFYQNEDDCYGIPGIPPVNLSDD